MSSASSGPSCHQPAPYAIDGAPPFGVVGGDTELWGSASRARSTYAHQNSIDRSIHVAARSSAADSAAAVDAAGGTPRASTRSMVSVRGTVVLPVAEVLTNEQHARVRGATRSSCARAGPARSTTPTIRRVRRRGRRATAPRRRRSDRGACRRRPARTARRARRRRCRTRGTSPRDRSRRACRRCRGSGRPIAPTALRTGETSGEPASANSSSACTAITSCRAR